MNKRPLTPRWDDPDARIYRAGEARDMIRAAGLPAGAAPTIIRTASERAENNHDLFFEAVQQQIEDFDKPLPEQGDRIKELAADLEKVPLDIYLMIADMVTDAYEMMSEGYSGPEIGLYLKRNYPVDD